MNFRYRLAAIAVVFAAVCSSAASATAQSAEPVVARIEMKLAVDDEVVNVIEKGDLLTVIEERDDDYVIVTHDGSKGAVDKNNAARIAESSDIYTQLIEEFPEEGRYYTLRAAAWWALGKTEQAVLDFDKAIELGYTEAHAYTSRGLFHAEMGSFDKAIADYDKALEVDPESIAPIINRAAVHMSRKDFDKAIADYTLVLKTKKNSASILHQRAIAHKAAGEMEQAVADFSRILKNNDKDRRAVMGRGYVHFQNGNHAAAIDDFAKAIELDPSDAVAWNNRGYNLSRLGRDAEAIKDYDKSLEIAPKYALAMQNRAWLLATSENEDVRDPEAAVEMAKAACELNNFTGVSDLSALAAALAAKGEFKEAIGWQEKVVEMVAEPFKEFAEKILVRYQNERPFALDPDKANAEDKKAAELEGKSKEQMTSTK
ncbi:TPR repeat-containing protein YrrB [Rubripirellula obstinata]|uniref:TPR repeat-containing protein YrrB n=1 Tax=Rubripirellula obstinata TaxID=406547 RepID=A0A5B1CM53_9BACT|nr:tetratricopeptide repeat protein [Rubripirellula obstinata]KAA1261412.1 TPR repeat-containing protein YrrB [Rubripirellula obstinata]